MVVSQDASPVGQHLLKQRDRPLHIPQMLIGGGQAAPERQGGGMIVAQEPFLASQCLLIQGDGAPYVARLVVGTREVMP